MAPWSLGRLADERIGELTLAVVFVSLAYYFTVVWVEVVAVMFPSLAFSFVSGAVDAKKDQVQLWFLAEIVWVVKREESNCGTSPNQHRASQGTGF